MADSSRRRLQMVRISSDASWKHSLKRDDSDVSTSPGVTGPDSVGELQAHFPCESPFLHREQEVRDVWTQSAQKIQLADPGKAVT